MIADSTSRDSKGIRFKEMFKLIKMPISQVKNHFGGGRMLDTCDVHATKMLRSGRKY